jgi:hypothetical protein
VISRAVAANIAPITQVPWFEEIFFFFYY